MVEDNKHDNKIVWFFGCPTAGKSWSADFCAKYHDWIHIDGDEEVKKMDPENYKAW
jgi:adenylate kinase family enzyme